MEKKAFEDEINIYKKYIQFGIENHFESEKEATFALYEQLFLSENSLCASTVLDAMKYLISKKSMNEQIEEMEYMKPCDLQVLHKRTSEEKSKEIINEFKQKVQEVLEENIS